MIENGKSVKVHYKGTLKDGEVFDSSYEREPLIFEIGSGVVIDGFNNAVSSLTNVGDKISVTIPPEQGYPVRKELIFEIKKENVNNGEPANIGDVFQSYDSNENPFQAIISDIKENTYIMDANFPLAGKDLIFEIELVEIL